VPAIILMSGFVIGVICLWYPWPLQAEGSGL
jgi:hypothetical protein